MARWILLAAATIWVIAAIAGFGVAAFGIGALEAALPPLAIDRDALRGTVVAVGCGLLAVGLVHVVALIGLAARRRWASTTAILLAAFIAVTAVALAAAAVTSASTVPAMASWLLPAAAGAAVAALAYGAAAASLVAARRRVPNPRWRT